MEAGYLVFKIKWEHPPRADMFRLPKTEITYHSIFAEIAQILPRMGLDPASGDIHGVYFGDKVLLTESSFPIFSDCFLEEHAKNHCVTLYFVPKDAPAVGSQSEQIISYLLRSVALAPKEIYHLSQSTQQYHDLYDLYCSQRRVQIVDPGKVVPGLCAVRVTPGALSVSDSSNEAALYQPFYDMLSPLCLNLCLVDCHSSEIFQQSRERPDFFLFDGATRHIKFAAGLAEIKASKPTASHSDLGQTLEYLHLLLNEQPLRQYAIGLLICPSWVVIMRAEIAADLGLLVHHTEALPLHDKATRKWLVGLLKAGKEVWGYVPSVVHYQDKDEWLGKRLGHGRSGIVYALENASNVVVKIAKPGEEGSLKKEWDVLSTLPGGCPHFPRVVGFYGNTLLLTPLGARLSASPTLLSHLEGLVDTLQLLHSAGVTHRDVRPENLLTCTHGVLLIDFGCATYHCEEAKFCGFPPFCGFHALGKLSAGVMVFKPDLMDDLWGSAFSAVAIQYPSVNEAVRGLWVPDNIQQSSQAILEFWEKQMRIFPEIKSAIEKKSYTELKSALHHL